MRNKDLKQLANLILDLKNQEEVIDFLEGILTPKEIADVGKRLQIVKMLKAGTPQREIADKLKVGIATVTRGSKEIKEGRFSQI